MIHLSLMANYERSPLGPDTICVEKIPDGEIVIAKIKRGEYTEVIARNPLGYLGIYFESEKDGVKQLEWHPSRSLEASSRERTIIATKNYENTVVSE